MRWNIWGVLSVVSAIPALWYIKQLNPLAGLWIGVFLFSLVQFRRSKTKLVRPEASPAPPQVVKQVRFQAPGDDEYPPLD